MIVVKIMLAFGVVRLKKSPRHQMQPHHDNTMVGRNLLLCKSCPGKHFYLSSNQATAGRSLDRWKLFASTANMFGSVSSCPPINTSPKSTLHVYRSRANVTILSTYAKNFVVTADS